MISGKVQKINIVQFSLLFWQKLNKKITHILLNLPLAWKPAKALFNGH